MQQALSFSFLIRAGQKTKKKKDHLYLLFNTSANKNEAINILGF